MAKSNMNEKDEIPSASTRRILLAVTGLSPQIMTETLFTLACRNDSPWVPHEIHLITTKTGKEHAKLNLLGKDGWFPRMCKDYFLPEIQFSAENIHVLADGAGNLLDDIRTPEQNTLAADFITDMVRKLTADEHNVLHVSIAGGRKTMGYYLGYALSLFGRPQDRLSHVLVSEPYEGNRDFYYPTPYEYPIHTRRGERELTVDARNAKIDLADIPFVRLRDGLPEALRNGRSSFSRVVTMANRGQEPASMVLNRRDRRIMMDDEWIDFGGTLFTMLLWLAERVKAGNGLTDISSPEMADEFLEVAGKLLGTMSGDFDRMKEALDWRKEDDCLNKFFEPIKTRINDKIKEVLGPGAARRYILGREKLDVTENGKPRKKVCYHLPLEASQIELI